MADRVFLNNSMVTASFNDGAAELATKSSSPFVQNATPVVPHVVGNETTSSGSNVTYVSSTTLKQILESVTNVLKNETINPVQPEQITYSSNETTTVPVLNSTLHSASSEHNTSQSAETFRSSSTAFADIVTLSTETTAHPGGDVEVHEASNVGVAVGVTIGVFVLLAVAVAVVVVFLRRRRVQRRKESEPVMENPQYTLERNSTLPKNFDLTMHTGPMVRNQLHVNSSQESLTRTNGRHKKDAPRPPIYKLSTSKDSINKRKAPAPPKLLGYEDLYEKDSTAGSAEALELTSFYAVNNSNAEADAGAAENETSQPLLESFRPEKKSPKRNSKVSSVERIPEPVEDRHEDEDEDKEMKAALLAKDKAASNLSLDSYDKEKNPFFSS